jgi:tryptophanyl-tRNA synthetase
MDLQDPTSKMSKSSASDAGCIFLLDEASVVMKKFKRAVTDSDSEVRYDRQHKPGVSNLLDILAGATGANPEALAEGYSQYGPLKSDAAEAVIELLRPIQHRYRELTGDPAELASLLHTGAVRARSVAAATLERAYRNIGLVPPT